MCFPFTTPLTQQGYEIVWRGSLYSFSLPFPAPPIVFLAGRPFTAKSVSTLTDSNAVVGCSPHNVSQPLLLLVASKDNINAFTRKFEYFRPCKSKMLLYEAPLVGCGTPKNANVIRLAIRLSCE